MSTVGHGKKPDSQRELATIALLECTTITEAATQAGVDESTLRRWLKEPEFAGGYRDARRALVSASTNRLARACNDAVSNLIDVMEHAQSASARITASKAILDYAYKALELEDIAARIDAVEAEMQIMKEMADEQRAEESPAAD